MESCDEVATVVVVGVVGPCRIAASVLSHCVSQSPKSASLIRILWASINIKSGLHKLRYLCGCPLHLSKWDIFHIGGSRSIFFHSPRTVPSEPQLCVASMIEIYGSSACLLGLGSVHIGPLQVVFVIIYNCP